MIDLTTLLTHAVGQFLNSDSEDPEVLISTIEDVLVAAFGRDHFRLGKNITSPVGEPLRKVVVLP